MLSELLQGMARSGLTSVQEIATVTGKGESTVYRWMSGDSAPDYASVRKLARELPNLQARKRLLEHFADSLPVIIVWTDSHPPSLMTAELDITQSPTLAACITAMGELAESMNMMLQGFRQDRLSRSDAQRAEHLINDAASELVFCRLRLSDYIDQLERDGEEPEAGRAALRRLKSSQ